MGERTVIFVATPTSRGVLARGREIGDNISVL